MEEFRKNEEPLLAVIGNFTVLEYLDGVELTNDNAKYIIEKCPLLKNFRISPGHFTRRVLDEVLKMNYLENFGFFRARAPLAFLNNINATPNKSVLLEFISRAPRSLKRLDLTSCADDEVVKTICEKLPHLEQLILDDCPNVTNAHIPDLIKSLPHLKQLVIYSKRVLLTEEIYKLLSVHPFLDNRSMWLMFEIDDTQLEIRVLDHIQGLR